MKLPFLRYSAVGVALCVGTPVFAQSEIPFILTARPKNTFSASVRIKSGGANVRFNSAGEVRARNVVTPFGYIFEDGRVLQDGPRTLPNGTNTPTPEKDLPRTADGKYFIFTASNKDKVEYIPYKEGETREWAFASASQLSNGEVAFRDRWAEYGAMSGETEAKASEGFDLQVMREIGRIGRSFAWGVTAGLGVTEVTGSTSGTSTATLHDVIYRFSLLGRTPTRAGSFGMDAISNVTPAGTPATDPRTYREDGPAIADKPTSVLDTVSPDGAEVVGFWRLRGGYFTARVGPSFRWEPLRRLSISGSAGLSVAYMGVSYEGLEQLKTPDFDDSTRPGLRLNRRVRDVNLDFYGELNAEFWITYRTGVFLGVLYEKIDSFEYVWGTRSASVDVGDGLVIRAGIVYRF